MLFTLVLSAGTLLASVNRTGQTLQAPETCRMLDTMPAIRRVQTSEAFKVVLDAIRRTWVSNSDTPPDRIVDAYCRSMKVAGGAELGTEALVYFAAGEGLEERLALFGVADTNVVLLSPVRQGVLESGLDLTMWNRFIAGLRPARDYSSKAVVVGYGCLVHSLVQNSFPGKLCNAEDRFEIRAAADSALRLRLARLRTQMVISADGQVKEYTVLRK